MFIRLPSRLALLSYTHIPCYQLKIGGASMSHQSHAETFQPYAALAEIRDSLLETYASNDAMNQLLLAHLDPRAWRAQPPGQKAKGRTIAAILAHLHGYRIPEPNIWQWDKLWKQAGLTTRPR